MARRKPLKYRQLRKVLKRFGVSESKKRGKGSERMFVGIVNGRVVTYPTKCHGEGDEKPVAVIEAIRRAFGLTDDRGVTDADFYGRAGSGSVPEWRRLRLPASACFTHDTLPKLGTLENYGVGASPHSTGKRSARLTAAVVWSPDHATPATAGLPDFETFGRKPGGVGRPAPNKDRRPESGACPSKSVVAVANKS